MATSRQRLGLYAGLGIFGLVCALPAPEGLASAGWRTAAVGLLMAAWWMTEAIPIAATALLPLVLLPLLGVAPVREVASPYANPLIFLFLGGFMIALAMQRWQLHRRIALVIIRTLGSRPPRVVAGFMVASAFLSMWISNTATALMMLPIGLSVVELVRSPADRENPEHGMNFAVCLMLGIAYACSIGGISTLIGTPTNALLAGFLLETYGVELSFVRWLLVGLPVTLSGLGLTFLVLTRLVFPIRVRTIPGGRAFIEEQLAELGAVTPQERRVAVVFVLTAALWMIRPLLTRWLPELSDAGVAVSGALLLFLLPAGGNERGEHLLDWSWAVRLPWSVLLLFGGGLSLAASIQRSGLAQWIGELMHGLAGWPVWGLLLLMVTVVVFLTELTSNTATAAAFLPVLASISVGLGQNPLLLLVPAVLGASCAFMLPVATPPNAIVYGSEMVSIPQMVRAGIFLNLLFIVLVTLAAFTLLPVVFDVQPGSLPAWVAGSVE